MGKKVFETVFALGTKLNPSFSKGMLSASKRMGEVQKQTTALGRQTKAIARFKELDSAVDKAGAEFTDASSDLKRLRAEAKRSPTVTAKMRSEIVKAEKAVTRTKTALDKKTAALRKTSRALKDADIDVGNLTAEEKRLAAQTAKLAKRQERLARVAGLKIGQRFNRVGASARTLGRDFARLGALGGGLAVALGALVKRTAAQGDSAAKLGANLGITAEAVQELRFAAERSGVSAGGMDKALLKLNQRIGEAAAGSSEARQGFAELGISGEDLRDKSPDDVLELVADRMTALPDEAARASAANRLFGRSGVRLVGVLGKGSDALRELRKDARRTGNVMSDEAAASAEATEDAMLGAKSAISGVANILGAELLPVATNVLTRFTGFVTENRKEIKVWAADLAQGIQSSIPDIIKLGKDIGSLIGKLIDGAKWVASFVGGWENLAIVLVGLRLAPLIGSVTSLAGGLAQATTGVTGLAGGLSGPLVAGALAAGVALGSLIDEYFPKLFGVEEKLSGVFGKFFAGGSEVEQSIERTQDAAERIGELLAPDAEPTKAALNEIADQWEEIALEGRIPGINYSKTFADGIRAGSPEAIAAVREQAAQVDEYLPHSDAIRGPLSRLTAAGRALPETFAAGVEQGTGATSPGAAVAGAAAGGAAGAGAGFVLTVNAPITVQGAGAGAVEGIAQAGDDLTARIERTVRALFEQQQRTGFSHA